MKGKILEAMREDKALYQMRKDEGLCVRCGKKLLPGDTTKTDGIRCGECRSLKYYEYKHGANVQARRKAAGLCIECGKVLIGTERADTVCEVCREKMRLKRERGQQVKRHGNSYDEVREAASSLEETCHWLLRTVRGVNADGMKTECIDCPWLKRRTEYEVNSYCPSASGTGPDTKDCLRFLCGPRIKTKRGIEQNE